MDQIYPAENRALAEKMEESGGCVMSEFCLGTAPDRQTFPMRNRIVSGLSKGLLVVEAARASGAMITARQALEQGRQVFAVPGRIDHPQSRGCHQLLKDGARLVESVEDVLAEFEPGALRGIGWHYFGYGEELSRILGQRVDFWSRLDPRIRTRIETQLVPLYERA